jgi:hypothetical protein
VVALDDFDFLNSSVKAYSLALLCSLVTLDVHLDEMRMKTSFTPFTLDESSAMHIQSVHSKWRAFELLHRVY